MKKLIILLLFIPSMLFAQTYYVCTGPYAYAMHGSYDCANANCSKEVVSMGCNEAHDKGYKYCNKCKNAGPITYAMNAEINAKQQFPMFSGEYKAVVSISGCNTSFNSGFDRQLADISVVEGEITSVTVNGRKFSCKIPEERNNRGYIYPLLFKELDYCGFIIPEPIIQPSTIFPSSTNFKKYNAFCSEPYSIWFHEFRFH